MDISREFVGFFYADGCAMLVKYRSKGRILVRPQLTIVQRSDNLPVLNAIKDIYGGSIYKRNVVKHNMPGTKPAYQWHLTNIEKCKEVTDLLLTAEFPYRSLDAVKAVNEYCSWRIGLGLYAKFDPANNPQIDKWRERVFRAHSFQVTD